MPAAEAEVGAALWKIDAADQLAFWIENGDAIESLLPHPPANPEISIHIDAQAVRRAIGFGGDKRFAARQLGLFDVVGPNDPRRRSCLDDVELRLVGRKRQTIGALDVPRDDRQLFR